MIRTDEYFKSQGYMAGDYVVRLVITPDEKTLLRRVAKANNQSMTAWIRSQVEKEAQELGIS